MWNFKNQRETILQFIDWIHKFYFSAFTDLSVENGQNILIKFDLCNILFTGNFPLINVWINLKKDYVETFFTFKRYGPFFSALTDGKHPAFPWKMSLSALILQILKNRLGGYWEVSGSISRIDGTKYYHGDCLHHLEGLIRVNDATCCMLSFWRMAAISLWAVTPHLNSHSRQLTGARGPTYQTAGRWTTWGEKEKICFWNGQSRIPRANEMLPFL